MTLPGFDPPPAPEGKPLSYGRRLTLARHAALERGQNPGSGLEIREPRNKLVMCGSCWHAIAHDAGNHGTVWKCELGRLSNSETTDIRLSWPGCKAWTKTDDGKSNAPAWTTRATQRK